MALCSLAIAAGVVGVVALVKRLAWRRRMAFGGGPFAMASCGPSFGGFGRFGGFGGGGCGPGAHSGGPPWARWRGHGRNGGFGGGIGNSIWLRALFARLDTTPGQEKEIRAALEELRTTAGEAKRSLKDSREGVARAVKGEVFDEIAIGEATVKVDAATGTMKSAFETALRRIHAALDGKQRERLAEILERGPRGFRGGPYRSSWQEI